MPFPTPLTPDPDGNPVIGGQPVAVTANAPPSTQATPSVSPTPNSTPSNAGAIAGGVIGGVVLLALIIGAFILVRRRKRRMAPSSEFLAQNPHWRTGTPNSLSELNGDNLPPFTQGSFTYPFALEKQRRGTETV